MIFFIDPVVGHWSKEHLSKHDVLKYVETNRLLYIKIQILNLCIPGNQLIMAACFWYFVNSDLYNVHVYSSVNWISRFSQGTRNTQPFMYNWSRCKNKKLCTDFFSLLNSEKADIIIIKMGRIMFFIKRV